MFIRPNPESHFDAYASENKISNLCD